MNVMSLGSAKYFFLFIGEASGHICAANLKSKGDDASRLEKYQKWMERLTGNRVKRIVLDGGEEYLKTVRTRESEGIDIDKSARYTPQENGRAERMNRTLKNSIRAMLFISEALASY